MPKLSDAQILKNKSSIEDAALKCFLKKGYNGVSVRDIAKKADLSLGNLYNYYPDKLTLFQTILKKFAADFYSPKNPIQIYIENCNFPDDLDKLALAIEKAVDRYEPYFKLTYIDVVEFEGKHVGGLLFSNVAEKFKSRLGHHFDKIGPMGPDKNIDPTFAFVAAYLQFYYFYALKKLFHSKNIYGQIPDSKVISQLCQLYFSGLRSKT